MIAHRSAVRLCPSLLYALGVAGWVACADIGAPSRGEHYEWRVFRSDPSGTGIDTLSFHWQADDLPVRFWVEDTLGLPNHVREGLALWEAAFLYGEFEGVVVSDSVQADVIVRSGQPAKASLGLRLRTEAQECHGETDIDLSEDRRTLRLPMRIFVDPRFLPDTPGVDECLARTTAHELGHAIGIFEHSPNSEDLMASVPTVPGPTARDEATAEVAYHTDPTLQVQRPAVPEPLSHN